MNDKEDTSLQTSPQLVESRDAVALSAKQTVSLYKKSKNSGIPFDILEEVYRRGFAEHYNDQKAFDRVNSFIADGFAVALDEDLMEKRGLWDNIHAKRERIKHGSGEHMRKAGSKGAPTAAALKASQNEDADPCWTGYKQVGMKNKNGKQVPNCVPVKEEEITELSAKTLKSFTQAIVKKDPSTVLSKHPIGDTIRRKKALNLALDKIRPQSAIRQPKVAANEEYTGAEKVSKNSDDASSRFVGTTSLTDVYKNQTPGQSLKTIKRVVRESLMECGGNCDCGCKPKKEIEENESWQKSKYKSDKGGLTQAGVDAFRREHPGSKLKTAVTTEPSKLKAGSKPANRRKSFCARMGGMKKRLTSAKTARDPDSRINKALRKWHCEELNIRDATGKQKSVSKVKTRMIDGSFKNMYPAKSSSASHGDEE